MISPGIPRDLDYIYIANGLNLVYSLTVTCANLRILTFLTIFRHFGVEKWSKYGILVLNTAYYACSFEVIAAQISKFD